MSPNPILIATQKTQQGQKGGNVGAYNVRLESPDMPDYFFTRPSSVIAMAAVLKAGNTSAEKVSHPSDA
jgi:hypothetical protein